MYIYMYMYVYTLFMYSIYTVHVHGVCIQAPMTVVLINALTGTLLHFHLDQFHFQTLSVINAHIIRYMYMYMYMYM